MADVRDRVVRWLEQRLGQVQGAGDDAGDSREGRSIRWLAVLLGLMLFSYEAVVPLMHGNRSVYMDLRFGLIVWLFFAAMMHMPMGSSSDLEDHPSVPFISFFILLLVITHITLAAFTVLHHMLCWTLQICFPKLAETLWVPGLRSVRSFKVILKGSILLSACVSLVFAYCGTVPETTCVAPNGAAQGMTGKQTTLAMLLPGADADGQNSRPASCEQRSADPRSIQEISEMVCTTIMPELDVLWGQVGDDGSFNFSILGIDLGQFSLLESPVGLLWLSGVAIWATYYTLRRTKRINQSIQRRALRRRLQNEREKRARAIPSPLAPAEPAGAAAADNKDAGGLNEASADANASAAAPADGEGNAAERADSKDSFDDEKDAEDAQEDENSDDEYDDEMSKALFSGSTSRQREQAPTNFRPMAEWYSLAVTRTAFDLLISMKLFLGRFDMRVMQAAIGDGPMSNRDQGPFGSSCHGRGARASAPTPESIEEESFSFQDSASSRRHHARPPPQSSSRSTNEPKATDSLVDDRFADLDEMWFDWLADTGDGGNPTYAVARAVAQPSLTMPMPAEKDQQQRGVDGSASDINKPPPLTSLKRGDLLILGGDLAYPTPSREEYASRLFQPFEYAMEPPISSHRDDISLAKNVHESSHVLSSRLSLVGSRNGTATTYSLPMGHHGGRDRSRSNENLFRSNSTISPPSGGSNPASSPMSGPNMLRQQSEIFQLGGFGEMTSANGSQRSLFAGASSLSIDATGDTERRHRRRNRGNRTTKSADDADSEDDTDDDDGDVRAVSDSDEEEGDPEDRTKVWEGPPCAYAIPGNHDWFDGLDTFMQCICYRDWFGGWRMPQSKSYFALKLPHGWWLFGLDFALEDDIDGLQYQYFASIAHRCLGERDQVILCSHEPTWLLDGYLNDPHPEDKPISRTSKNLKQLVRRHLRGRVAMRIAGDVHNYMRYDAEQPLRRSALRAGAAPVLITSGGGGAFLHPTHTFPERFKETGAYYKLQSAYPTFADSRMVGMKNLGQGFRMQNWRFDIVGSTVYFLVVCSFFPRCNLDAIMKAPQFYPEGLRAFGYEILLIFGELFSDAYVSLIATLGVYFTAFCFADYHHGTLRQLTIATLHGLAHVTCAVALFLVLEIVAELAIKDGLAGQGYDSIFEVFQSFERRTMPEAWWTTGFLETTLRFMLRIFDLPENMATTRAQICKGEVPAPGVGCAMPAPSQLSRFDLFSYYLGNFLYMYIIAADLGAMILGLYLYICVTFFKLHWNEAFSSIRCEDYKTFMRFRIDADGDLHAYVIGIDRVPRKWRDDARWSSTWTRLLRKHLTSNDPDLDELDPSVASYGADYPSRWIPAYTRNRKFRKQQEPRIVDYFCIPRKRRWLKPRRGKSTISAGDWWEAFENLEQRKVFQKVH